MSEEYPMYLGWEPGNVTSPAWYSCLNEMLILQRFVKDKDQEQEYEEFKKREWPVMAREMLLRMEGGEKWNRPYLPKKSCNS